MATQSNIDIKIIAEFVGKNAFKQADSAANKLNNTVKSLGQSFGLAFGGAALGYAIKTTIKDFAEAQRETVNLTNTVKNLGLAFDAPQVTAYVDKIGKLYGVTGDQAVPALQALLSVTGSVSKSTEIFNTALDLAASRSANVADVAQDLANAYVGNAKGLNQYRLGLTRAELSAKTFEEIMAVIGKQTMGAADEAAQSLTGQLAILSEVTNQARERIGGGLVEALGGLSGPNGAGGAAKNIENLSIKLTNAITGFGYLVQEVKIAQPILVGAGIAIGLAWAPWFTALSVAALAIGAIGNAMKKNQPQIAMNTGPLFFPGAGDGGYAEREKARRKAEREALARNKQLAKLIKDQAKAAADIVKQRRIQNAIDKANLVLGKGEEVFDLDKIQIAAALTNQAEQLGKATSSSQLLQIANDTARLNVKRSILALEDAIAAKDEAAIIAATAKLNADLKVLGTLGMQNVKLQDIKTILDSLKPKDLINISNLEAALRLLREINLTSTGSKTTPAPVLGGGGSGGGGGMTPTQIEAILAKEPTSVSTTLTPAQVSGNRYAAQAEAAFTKMVEQVALATQTAQNSFLNGIQAGLNIPAAMSGARYAAQAQAAAGGQGYVININAGVGSDPNAIAEAIDNVLREARDRGTLTIL